MIILIIDSSADYFPINGDNIDLFSSDLFIPNWYFSQLTRGNAMPLLEQ